MLVVSVTSLWLGIKGLFLLLGIFSRASTSVANVHQSGIWDAIDSGV
ncbi:MAG: hypothetical protein HC892_06145 [Saprospiraceae bacterium]|nr:hypothetical protein [Saprospiraceae bacterium]